VKVFYATPHVQQLPPGHRFPMGKYEILRRRLELELNDIELELAVPASEGELALVHAPAYIEAIFQGSLTDKAQREIGFNWSPGMVERARGSVGATICASRTSIEEGVSCNLAGGTHHAYPNKGSGFCVFNDVAVATRLMQAEWSRHTKTTFNIAIIDLDVHQGNGTAKIFENDDSVFTLSIHAEKNFPFRKEISSLDVALPDGCGDDLYMNALERALHEIDMQFQPQMLFYLAGADPHEGDRLGRMNLTFDGLESRDRRVFDWAYKKRLPLAMVMAGGYGKNIEDTVQVQINTLSVARQYWQHWQNREL